MSAAKLEKVRWLFKEWDFEEEGRLELNAFKGVGIQSGPHKTQLMSSLAQMDADNDGYVTQEEWEGYFGVLGADFSDADFAELIDEMASMGESIVTVLRCTRLAQSAPFAAAGEASGDGAEAPSPLSEARLALVRKLFETWDVGGKGAIDPAKLQAHGMKVGPAKSELFSNLEKMDLDMDGSVTLAEMETYFAVAASSLSDDEFGLVVEEMQKFADEGRLILDLVAINAEAAGGAVPLEAVPLTAEREKLLEELYLVFADSTSQPIKISALQTAKLRNGPYEDNLSQLLMSMDVDGDGDVTIEEMRSHFSLIGGGLNDDEFGITLNDLTTAARAAKVARDLA